MSEIVQRRMQEDPSQCKPQLCQMVVKKACWRNVCKRGIYKVLTTGMPAVGTGILLYSYILKIRQIRNCTMITISD